MTSIQLPSGFNQTEFGLIKKTIQVGQLICDVRRGIIAEIALPLMGLAARHFSYNRLGKVLVGLSVIPFFFALYRYRQVIVLERELKPQIQAVTDAFQRLLRSLEACNENRVLLLREYVLQENCKTEDECKRAALSGVAFYEKGQPDVFKNLTDFNPTLIEDSLKLRDIADDMRLCIDKVSLLNSDLVTSLRKASGYCIDARVELVEDKGTWQIDKIVETKKF